MKEYEDGEEEEKGRRWPKVINKIKKIVIEVLHKDIRDLHSPTIHFLTQRKK